MDEPPADALRRKKDSSMRVAINLVEGRPRRGLRLRRQHRRADGDLALRAQDAARHRPPGDRLAAAHAQGRDHGARPRRQCRLHAGAAAAVRGDGHGAGVGGRRQVERPTVGLLNIGEEDIKGNDVVKRAAELLKASRAQLPRQRRRQRHLQGHHRRRRLRRLRRQRRAQDLRRPGGDALRLPQGRVHAQPAHQARRAGRLPGAEVVQAAHRPAPLQRRDAARAQGRRRQEPRRRRRCWRSGMRSTRRTPRPRDGVLERIATADGDGARRDSPRPHRTADAPGDA